MAARPKYAKPDANQAEIIADLRKMGVYVWITAALGGEVLDAIVFWRGRTVPVEFKAVGSENDLTDGEREGIRRLHAVGVTAVVATCARDVMDALLDFGWKRGSWGKRYNAHHNAVSEAEDCISCGEADTTDKTAPWCKECFRELVKGEEAL